MERNRILFFYILTSILLISTTMCDVIRCPPCPSCDIADKADALNWTPRPNMGVCAAGMSF